MKKIYEIPVAELVKLDMIDIVTTSLPEFDDPNILDDGWVEA